MGDVLEHITCEQIDPMALTPKQREKANLHMHDYEGKSLDERMVEFYTSCSWQTDSKVWKIMQEVEGVTVGESEEKVTPYFSTPYKLVPQDHYGRGFVELHLAELQSLDTMEQRRLDIIGLIAKGLIGVDKSSTVRTKDLEQNPGGIIRNCNVRDGQITDLGILSFELRGEFQMVTAAIEEKKRDSGAAFLLNQAAQRDAERVTAVERRQNANELNDALGGVYGQIADEQQLPLIRRVYHVMQRNGEIPKIPEQLVEISAITGLEAMTNEAELATITEVGSLLAQLGDEGVRRINIGVLIDEIMRLRGAHVPDLIKSDEQLAQEQQQAMQQAIAQQAIESGGKVVENTAPKMLEGNAA